MYKLKSNHGGVLVDVMLAVFFVSIAGIIFASTYPTSILCSKQTQEYKIATAIAQRKMEQLRRSNFESLDQLSTEIIDSGSSYPNYTFTQVDDFSSMSNQLRSGTGTISVTPISSSIKKVQVTVSWKCSNNTNRQVQLITLFADKRTRAVN